MTDDKLDTMAEEQAWENENAIENDDVELDRVLADDVDATIERLGELISIDSDRQMQTPFGQMTEADMLGLIRPSLWQWVGSHRDTAIAAVALIHRATGDLLDKHAPDEDPDELADDALDEA